MGEKAKTNVFHKESDILANAQELVNNDKVSTQELADEYVGLSNHYEKLLKETKMLTSVSDRLHHKINDANSKLTVQSNEIGEMNEELKTNNQVLQETIDKLTQARIGQKASSIVLLIAILLFVFSEVLVEPIIEQNTDSEYIGLLLKGMIALLLKPIDILIERFLMKRAINKMSKFELVQNI